MCACVFGRVLGLSVYVHVCLSVKVYAHVRYCLSRVCMQGRLPECVVGVVCVYLQAPLQLVCANVEEKKPAILLSVLYV